MSVSINKKNKGACSSKEDIDLEALITEPNNNQNGLKDTDDGISSDYTEILVLHESSESLNGEGGTVHSKSFFDKSFLKSLPVAILAKRKIFGSNSELVSSNTNPSSLSSPGTPRVRRAAGSFPSKKADRLSACKTTENSIQRTTWNVWVSDKSAWEEVALPRRTSCAVLLHMLLSQLQRFPDLTQWSIIEQSSEMERFVEDFELMKEVVSDVDSREDPYRLCLNRSPGKYSILEKPDQCIPEDMLTYASGVPPWQDGTPALDKRSQMKDILTKTAPEMCGRLWLRDSGRKSWKKCFCVLRNSGFYYSTNDTNKDSESLVCISEIHSSVVWFPKSNKTKLQATGYTPTSHVFCLKPRSNQTGANARWICAESNQLKVAWINGLRLTLNGNRFHKSYLNARNFDPTNLIRSSSERCLDKSDGNIAPTDSSDTNGRVIDKPVDVVTTTVEKKPSWRKRLRSRTSRAGLGLERGIFGSSAPTKSNTFVPRAVHTTQPWFYGKITREFAAQEIQRHGSLDGTFLLRESQTISGSVVITICHSQKSRHIPITQIVSDGLTYYTCDNGETRFLDLTQLVDFHRINKGALPSPLLHECTKSSS